MAVPAAATMACPRCGEGRPVGARFCLRCGLPLSDGGMAEAARGVATSPVGLALPAPSVVGRRGSRTGWIGAVLGAAVFLALAVGVVIAAGTPAVRTPTARWDASLQRPAAATPGSAFDVSAEAANPATAATDRLWLLIEWQRDGASLAVGRLVGCQPANCQYREDTAAGITVLVWPGLAGGSHQLYGATLVVDRGLAGESLRYRVTAGTGAAEGRLRDTVRWTVMTDIR